MNRDDASTRSPHVRESESGKFFQLESRGLESVIHNGLEWAGIRNPGPSWILLHRANKSKHACVCVVPVHTTFSCVYACASVVRVNQPLVNRNSAINSSLLHNFNRTVVIINYNHHNKMSVGSTGFQIRIGHGRPSPKRPLTMTSCIDSRVVLK